MSEISSASTTATYALWKRLPAPVRSVAFSAGMCARVPFFAAVFPRVRELEPGRCVVSGPKWFGVHNHLGTFHAIAACNLAEVAMGMLAEATVPTTHRWIPKAMTVQYLAPGRTSLTATAQLAEVPEWNEVAAGRELVVPVSLRDTSGAEVVRADITIWISAK
ncbi:hotdog fold domain-containing protein [Rhodococcus sp. MEB064]|uniref:hotdog fold domain-containing protein n=1 Tax=Rhodococcus sp. MEB064 TaxID=1587522 RepID=UPI0005ACCA87|nr:hotdog fold domain-containing protein [Rhodococcus sp. MEB064]KIQ15370.1 thioesterase [Rhodococcus sp. MEB064]